MSASISQSDPPLFPAITFCDQEGALSFSVPASASSLDGFRQWALSDDFPERGKITFVAGELIIDMSPESLEEHSDIKSEICRVLLNLVRQQNLGRLHIDGVLVSNEAARVSNEPDILYLSKASLKSGRAKLTPAIGRPQSSKEIVGSVDWVLEIVSPTSMRKDKVLLREAYYQAGIDEYWIIDGLGQKIEFQLLTRGEKEFVAVERQDDWLQSPTFDRQFRLEREKEDDGSWRHTLHIQASAIR